MERIIPTRCPYCQSEMKAWVPPEVASWTEPFHLVCFNDDCPYYVRGWAWMESRYNVKASYRYRVDPSTGEAGPLPVWSKDAMRNRILQQGAEVDA
ncbi:MAG TPA: ogr/Delta-like zinc finger family protein [bacterium]|nr:ogr/Delta-like zinc finger family protein [bacterium]